MAASITFLKKTFQSTGIDLEFTFSGIDGVTTETEILCYLSDTAITSVDGLTGTAPTYDSENAKYTVHFDCTSSEIKHFAMTVKIDDETTETILSDIEFKSNLVQFVKKAYRYDRYSNAVTVEYLFVDETGKPVKDSITRTTSTGIEDESVTQTLETNNLLCYYGDSAVSDVSSEGIQSVYNSSKGTWSFTYYTENRNSVVVKNATTANVNGTYEYVSGTGWNKVFKNSTTNYKIKQFVDEGTAKHIWGLFDSGDLVIFKSEENAAFVNAMPTSMTKEGEIAFLWMYEIELPADYTKHLKIKQTKTEYTYPDNTTETPTGTDLTVIISDDTTFDVFSSEVFDESINEYVNKQNISFLADSTSLTPDSALFKREYTSISNTDKLYTSMSVSDITNNKSTFVYLKDTNTNNTTFVIDETVHQKAKIISFTKDFGTETLKPVPNVYDLIKGYDFSAYPITDMILEYVKTGENTHSLYLYQALPEKTQKNMMANPTFKYLGATTFDDDSYKIVKHATDTHRWNIYSRSSNTTELKGILTDIDFTTELVSTTTLLNGFSLITADDENAMNTAYNSFIAAYNASTVNDYNYNSSVYENDETSKSMFATGYVKGALIGECLSATAAQVNNIRIPNTPTESFGDERYKIGYVDYTGHNWTTHTKYQILIHGNIPARNRQYIESYVDNDNDALKLSGDYLMSYFNRSTYMFDNMSVWSQQIVTSTGKFGLPAYPTAIRTVYFPKELTIVRKQTISYVKDSTKDADFRFSIKYDGVALPEDVTKELAFNTIWIGNSQSDVGKTYTPDEDEEEHTYQDYPAKLSDKNTDDEGNVIGPTVYNTTKYGDDGYHHLSISYGKPPELKSYGYTVTGLSGSVGQDSNGTYYYVSGTGWDRVFKHSSKDYYIRRRVDDSRWCITTVAPGSDCSNDYVKVSEYNSSYGENMPTSFTSWNGNNVSGTANLSYFDAEDENGVQKSFYMKAFDKYGNHTDLFITGVEIYNIAPYDKFISIIGSSGQANYTGFYQKHRRYFPSDYVTVRLSGRSKVKLQYQISGDVVESTEWQDLTKTSENYSHVVRIKPVNTNEKLLCNDTLVTVRVNFKDEAGNEGYIDGKIKFISTLYRTLNQNLLEESTDYSHSLFPVEGSTVSTLTRKQVSTTEFVRSWNEIYYPEEHGMPTNTDGSINDEEALRISNPNTDESKKTGPSQNELTLYDRLALTSDGTLERDSEGRFVQNISAWTTTKTYPSNLNKLGVNSTDSDYKYWIIDNTGNTEFKLEFEVFDLDGGVTKLPANYSAGSYEGDTVVVYDASAVGCTATSIDENGNTVYTLVDSSKLKELFALKGSYLPSRNNPFKILGDNIVETLTASDSGFITPSITSTSRVCIMLYSDSQGEGSGFKIKAGPKHALEYLNYECNNEMGEFWIHISPSSVNGQWKGCDELQMNYKHYGSFATIDREKATVKFDSRQDYFVTGTFTHYLYLNTDGTCEYPYGYFVTDAEKETDLDKKNCIHDFMLFNDDLVDYSEPSFYVAPDSIEPDKTSYYEFENYLVANSGKLSNNYTLNKDTGILSFPLTVLVPKGRIFGDYFYHTFYRLTNDGYGDLHFYGTGILVPASATESYTDWTYVNLKIINEGTNQLNNGTLKFLARGYISSGTTVDTVLDNNRPWDVQEGTVAETVQRCGAKWSTSYSGLPAASRKEAFSAKSSQSVSFGTLNSKSAVYLRVYWCICNDENGTSWIDCTRGSKCFSAEMSGKYYVFTTGA